jgi:hypothetical protein
MRPVRLPPFVFVAALLAAVLAPPSSPPAMAGPMGPPSQQPTPEEIARGYLAKAREYGAGSEKLEAKCDPHAIDGFYAAAEAAWNAVWTCPGSREILCEAALVYADALEGLLATADAHGRIDGRGLWVGSRWKPTCVPIQTRGLPVDATAIERVVATPPPGDSRITRRHVRGGFGLPVALRVKPATHGTAAREFMPPRQSLAATAVLRFKMPGDENQLEKFSGPLALDHPAAILDLANPVEIAAVHIGPARPLLAADLTAPLLDMLEGMPRAGISGFLQPFGPGDTQPRLEFLQPHRPGRIPVVFIHGLASDEGTWFDMINELQSWPTFHRRYEPWVYHYPTGASFLVSSATLRRQLTAAVEQLDPSGSDQALRSMVLVGHSMGGLHAKLQVVDPGTALWDALACKPFDEIVMRPEIRRKVAPNYFFRPRPFVKRIVFIATPHSGSMLASLGVGRAASLTVRQPPESKAIHDEVVAANPDGFRQWYARRLPTTIDALEPSSPLIKSLRELRVPCWVTTHSVIGVAPQSLATCPGDCVVAAESARLPDVVSEITVPAAHTRVHHHPETIREVERILSEHLRETGL